MTTERRSAPLEVRAKGRRLTGYAALFHVEATLDGFSEIIEPGAFLRSLQGDVLALVDHDPARVLARTRNKTLRLAEDSTGLAFDIDVPATSYGRDVLELANRGDLGGASFGFTMPKGGDTWDGMRRTLRNVTLHEISVVSAWPAYEGTVVNARTTTTPTSDVANFRLVLARRYLKTLS
jgi:HK97 family phage prohead protease